MRDKSKVRRVSELIKASFNGIRNNSLPFPSTLKLTTILPTPRNELSTTLFLLVEVNPLLLVPLVFSAETSAMCFTISLQILSTLPDSTVPRRGTDTLCTSGPSNVMHRSYKANRLSCKSCLVRLRSSTQSLGVHMARIWEL